MAITASGKKYRFKLLAGRYSLNAGTDEKPQLIRFGMNDIIETDLELDVMFNSPGSTKFERLAYEGPDTEDYLERLQADLDRRKAELAKKKETEKVPEPSSGEVIAPPVDDELSGKTLDQLKGIAKANNIPLGNAKTRDDVLKVVREAMVEA